MVPALMVFPLIVLALMVRCLLIRHPLNKAGRVVRLAVGSEDLRRGDKTSDTNDASSVRGLPVARR